MLQFIPLHPPSVRCLLLVQTILASTSPPGINRWMLRSPHSRLLSLGKTAAQDINAFQPRNLNVTECLRLVTPVIGPARNDDAYHVIPFQHNLAANTISHPILSSYQQNSAFTCRPNLNHSYICPNTFNIGCQIQSDRILSNKHRKYSLVYSLISWSTHSLYPSQILLTSAHKMHSQSSSYPQTHFPSFMSVFTAASVAPISPLPL